MFEKTALNFKCQLKYAGQHTALRWHGNVTQAWPAQEDLLKFFFEIRNNGPRNSEEETVVAPTSNARKNYYTTRSKIEGILRLCCLPCLVRKTPPTSNINTTNIFNTNPTGNKNYCTVVSHSSHLLLNDSTHLQPTCIDMYSDTVQVMHTQIDLLRKTLIDLRQSADIQKAAEAEELDVLRRKLTDIEGNTLRQGVQAVKGRVDEMERRTLALEKSSGLVSLSQSDIFFALRYCGARLPS